MSKKRYIYLNEIASFLPNLSGLIPIVIVIIAFSMTETDYSYDQLYENLEPDIILFATMLAVMELVQILFFVKKQEVSMQKENPDFWKFSFGIAFHTLVIIVFISVFLILKLESINSLQASKDSQKYIILFPLIFIPLLLFFRYKQIEVKYKGILTDRESDNSLQKFKKYK